MILFELLACACPSFAEMDVDGDATHIPPVYTRSTGNIGRGGVQ